jgi:hypothetical protein
MIIIIIIIIIGLHHYISSLLKIDDFHHDFHIETSSISHNTVNSFKKLIIINELAITTETLQRLSKSEYSWASTNRMKYIQSAPTPATNPTATNGINKSNQSRNNNNNAKI